MKDAPTRGPNPVRLLAIEALRILGVPVPRAKLSEFVEAAYGRKVAAMRWVELARADRQAIAAGKDLDPALCTTITSSLSPVEGVLALSDWPVRERVQTARGARLQWVKLAARAAEIAEGAAMPLHDARAMWEFARKLADGLDGVKTKWGEFDFEAWRAAALRMAEDLEETEMREADEAVRRLDGRPLTEALYGIEPEGDAGDVAGSAPRRP